ncbi:McrB family protein [Campylobacter concisus]
MNEYIDYENFRAYCEKEIGKNSAQSYQSFLKSFIRFLEENKVYSIFDYYNSKSKNPKYLEEEFLKSGKTKKLFTDYNSAVNKYIEFKNRENNMKRYWIFTNQKNKFNAVDEFKQNSIIQWDNERKDGYLQLSEVKKGDIVYIYSGEPIAAIVVKTEILDISQDKRIIDLKFLKFTNQIKLSRTILDKYENLKNIQGKREIKSQESIYYILNNEDIDKDIALINTNKLQQNREFLPLNQILYGPPGTGKTYKLSKIMDKFTQNLNVKSSDDTDALYEMLKIENYNWYQVAAAILYDAAISNTNGGWLKLNNGIVDHTLFKLKSIKSGSKTPTQTISSDLLFHTKIDCEYVKTQERRVPFIFEKNEKSEWHVDAKILNDECPEAIEIYEKYKEIKEQKVGTSYTKENFKFITFHQSYGYEEFVEGIKPVFDSENEDGDITYEISKGIFYQCCENALLLSGYKGKLRDFCDLPKDERQKFFNENTPKYAIFIDEINRGNISKIFGELITLIEPSKRLGADDEIMVELPYSKEKFGVPSNLYIIGTMNTADRSIALMDTALRRRFEFVEMMPEYDNLNKINIEGINIGEMLKTINDRIEYLYDRDHTIGHAYFMGVTNMGALANVFKNKILPLLQEYFYDDWEKIRLVLGDSQFIKEKKPAKVLFKSGTDYINDKILYEIDKEAFYVEQNYLKIYNLTSSQADEANPDNDY